MTCADEAHIRATAAAWCGARTAAQRVFMLAHLRGPSPVIDVVVVVAGRAHALPKSALLKALDDHAQGDL